MNMEGYIKIPKNVFELGLNPNEFTVLVNLLRVQDYREFKGEVEDGWFAKSKNELTKECGFGCHKRLTRVLDGMVKMNIVQITHTKSVTYFKLTMGEMPIGQNEHMGEMPIPTMGKMTIDTMGKMPNLHNNSNKHKEQTYTTSPDYNTTSTCNNESTFEQKYISKKEKVDDKELPVPEVTKKGKSYYIECFENGIGKGDIPTVDQIAGFIIKNNIVFDFGDFKDKISYKEGNKFVLSSTNIGLSAISKLRPMKTDYGYSFSYDTNTVMEFMKKYVESDKHQNLNIIVK